MDREIETSSKINPTMKVTVTSQGFKRDQEDQGEKSIEPCNSTMAIVRTANHCKQD